MSFSSWNVGVEMEVDVEVKWILEASLVLGHLILGRHAGMHC